MCFQQKPPEDETTTIILISECMAKHGTFTVYEFILCVASAEHSVAPHMQLPICGVCAQSNLVLNPLGQGWSCLTSKAVVFRVVCQNQQEAREKMIKEKQRLLADGYLSEEETRYFMKKYK